MLNLLPPEQRNRATREYRWRRNVVIAGAVVVTVIVAILLLIPTYVFSRLSIDEIKSQKRHLEQRAEEKNRPQLAETLRRTHEIVNELSVDGDADSVYVSDVLAEITARGEGHIEVTGFVYEEILEKRPDSPPVTVVAAHLDGIARSREDLFEFKEEIEQVAFLSDIELPLSSFAQSRDIQFSMRMSIDQPDTE